MIDLHQIVNRGGGLSLDMFGVYKMRGLMMRKLAGLALLSAACVVHAGKPAADSNAHALGPAGHAAPPGLTKVIFVPPAAERD